MTIAIVNPGEEQQSLLINWANVTLSSKAKQWLITGSDAQAYNEPGVPAQVRIVEADVVVDPNRLQVPGLSVLLLRFQVN
jgi:alpha-L-arabinofuranosidase